MVKKQTFPLDSTSTNFSRKKKKANLGNVTNVIFFFLMRKIY